MSATAPPVEAPHWRVDKTIPLPLILTVVVTILGQTGGLVYWASRLESRVSQLEANDVRVDTLINNRIKLTEERWESTVRDRDRTTRIEERIGFIFEAVRRIDNRLERNSGVNDQFHSPK